MSLHPGLSPQVGLLQTFACTQSMRSCRESGNAVALRSGGLTSLDPRFRGDDAGLEQLAKIRQAGKSRVLLGRKDCVLF